jgi:hypothetical protein
VKKLYKLDFFSNNLVKKRNFFVNLLILSSLALVFSKNIEKIRYASVTTENGTKYLLDRFTSSIKLAE